MRVFRRVKARTAFPHKKRSLIRTVIISGNLLILFRITWSSLGISKSDNAIFKPLQLQRFSSRLLPVRLFQRQLQKNLREFWTIAFAKIFSIIPKWIPKYNKLNLPVHKLISRNEKIRDWNYCRTKMQLKTTQQQRHLLKQKDIQYENETCRNWTPSTNKSEKYIQYEIAVSDMFYLFEKGGD